MLVSLLVQVESAYFCALIASADEYGVFVYDPEEYDNRVCSVIQFTLFHVI